MKGEPSKHKRSAQGKGLGWSVDPRGWEESKFYLKPTRGLGPGLPETKGNGRNKSVFSSSVEVEHASEEGPTIHRVQLQEESADWEQNPETCFQVQLSQVEWLWTQQRVPNLFLSGSELD